MGETLGNDTVLEYSDRVTADVCDYARFIGIYIDDTLGLVMTAEVADLLAHRLLRAVVEHGYINRGR